MFVTTGRVWERLPEEVEVVERAAVVEAGVVGRRAPSVLLSVDMNISINNRRRMLVRRSQARDSTARAKLSRAGQGGQAGYSRCSGRRSCLQSCP